MKVTKTQLFSNFCWNWFSILYRYWDIAENVYFYVFLKTVSYYIYNFKYICQSAMPQQFPFPILNILWVFFSRNRHYLHFFDFTNQDNGLSVQFFLSIFPCAIFMTIDCEFYARYHRNSYLEKKKQKSKAANDETSKEIRNYIITNQINFGLFGSGSHSKMYIYESNAFIASSPNCHWTHPLALFCVIAIDISLLSNPRFDNCDLHTMKCVFCFGHSWIRQCSVFDFSLECWSSDI